MVSKPSNKTSLKLHLVQFPSTPGKPLKTLQRLEKLLKKIQVHKNDWLVFPEMWPGLFQPEIKDKQVRDQAYCFHWLKRFAREKKCYLVGSMLELPKRQAFNTAFVINPQGELLASYRKINLFPLAKEHILFRAGRKTTVVSTPWGKIGLAICYDLRFPEHFRKLTREGAQIILVPSAWPQERAEHFHALLKARAIENQCFVVGVNKCGPEKDGLIFGGGSVLFDPWGQPLLQLKNKTEIGTITIDLKQVKQIRKKYPFLPKNFF